MKRKPSVRATRRQSSERVIYRPWPSSFLLKADLEYLEFLLKDMRRVLELARSLAPRAQLSKKRVLRHSKGVKYV